MSNKLDQFYRSLVLSKYFTKGWGKPENLKRICEFRKIVSNRESCFKLVPPNYPVYIERVSDHRDYSSFDGYFITPFAQYLPEVVPVECYKAYFQLILPKKWQDENYKPVILQIAGTGDQYYWRRRNLIAKPLIKEAGIGSIILENPFYGKRKPLEQRRTILHNVSDIFVMGGCLILESLVLFHFCERLGYGPLGVTGLSMGGHMASLAATCWPKPLIVVPCLSGLTASSVFTQGAISGALNWDMLEEQFHSDSSFKEEIMKMIDISQGDAFKAGQQFAKHLSFKPHLKYSDPAVGTSDSDFCGNNSKASFDFHFTSSGSLETIKTGKSSSTPEDLSFALFQTNDYKSGMLSLRKMVKKNAKKKESPDSEFLFSSSSTKLQHLFDSSGEEEKFPSKSLHERFDNSYSSKMKASLSESIFKSFSSLSNLSTLLTSANFPTKPKEKDAAYLGIELSEPQAYDFMNGIMDECTHLKNYSTPVDASLVIAVCAENDAYVPLKGMSKLNEVWPGAEVRYVKGGHVRAYIQCQRKFRLAIIDAFSRYRSKYVIST